MNWTDRITILIGAAVVGATLGVGTCSTNERIDDVHRRISDVNANVNARIDDVHTDVREIRGLLIEVLQNDRADQ